MVLHHSQYAVDRSASALPNIGMIRDVFCTNVSGISFLFPFYAIRYCDAAILYQRFLTKCKIERGLRVSSELICTSVLRSQS